MSALPLWLAPRLGRRWLGLASCSWRRGRRRPCYSLGLGWRQLYVLERLDLGECLWLWALQQLRLVVITVLPRTRRRFRRRTAKWWMRIL